MTGVFLRTVMATAHPKISDANVYIQADVPSSARGDREADGGR